ncbi:phosphoribosyltransferase family protein [Leadbetterella sp. DM7]|uniref:phosphoribosyltransferase family protein n=1 Tax=Leadbetterella sp. DM7 TaxID=3235085 RepID=UPI00349F03CE
MSKALLLTREKTLQKAKRIAYQILENNTSENEVVVAGIGGEGYVLAGIIVNFLQEISGLKVTIARLSFDKTAGSQPDITIESEVDTFRNKSVVIVDDVLNSGKTLAFCLRPFLSIPLRKLQVAVMVDRNHPLYPIKADFVGYSLSTTLSDHVRVILSDEENAGVYLY